MPGKIMCLEYLYSTVAIGSATLVLVHPLVCICACMHTVSSLKGLCVVQLEGLRALVQPNGGWRPNFATQLRAAAMQQLRGDKLSMKASLDLILSCAYGDKAKAMPGQPSVILCITIEVGKHNPSKQRLLLIHAFRGCRVVLTACQVCRSQFAGGHSNL